MNLEKYTDRAKGFLQAAQTVAIRLNHQRITTEHSGEVEEALEREQGFVIACCNASLLFEFAEHALDAVSVLVAAIVGMLWHLAVRARRDDRQDAPDQQAFPEAITIIALVREQRLGCGDGDRHQRFGSGVIGSLAAGQDEADRQSLIVAAGVDFARKAAA